MSQSLERWNWTLYGRREDNATDSAFAKSARVHRSMGVIGPQWLGSYFTWVSASYVWLRLRELSVSEVGSLVGDQISRGGGVEGAGGRGPRGTLRAPLSGTYLQKKDVVNCCLEFGRGANLYNLCVQIIRHSRCQREPVWPKLQALVYDIFFFSQEGVGKRCSECGSLAWRQG